MTISKAADENYGSVEAIHDYAIGILKKYRSYYSGAWTDWVNIPNHSHTPADIGAVPISRTINEKPLSSNITLNASDVGAAPSGYGYGDAVKTTIINTQTGTEADFNTALDSEFSKMGNETAQQVHFTDYSTGIGDTFLGTLYKNWSSYGWLKGVSYSGHMMQKVKKGGAWQPWEWVNPPMQLGVEYCTTERWNGKAVYKKRDSNGTMWYRLDGESGWVEGVPGAAPAYSWNSGTLSSAGWYKVGTIKPVGGDFTTAGRISIGGNYNTINHSSAIIDIITDYDSIDAVVTVPTVKNAGITQVGFVRTEMKTFDVYVGYANNSVNDVFVSADMLRGTFVEANFVASSVAESAMAKVVAINKSSFAPSGYGLGENVQKIDLDTVTKSGNYKGSIDLGTNIGVVTCWCRADMSSDNYGTMTAHSEINGGFSLKRTKNNGVWGEWEWVNPPMIAWMEYRTTERYNGAAVYAKLVYVANLPNNATKTIDSVIDNGFTRLVDLQYTVNTSWTKKSHDSRVDMTVGVESPYAWLTITTTADMSTYSGYVLIKWTKD